MRTRFFLPGLIALLLAAFGLLGPGAPAQAAPTAAMSMTMGMPMSMNGGDTPCPMHTPEPSHHEGMPAGCPCCCAAVAALPQVASPAPPSVVRLAMAPVPELTGGPGRTIPPALGPPRAGA